MSQGNNLWRLLPRRSPAVVAVLVIWFGLRFQIANETPVGRIEGSIALAENHRLMPGAEITLSPHDEEGKHHDDANDLREERHVVSDHSGHFLIGSIPVGEYDIAASANHHQAPDVRIQVEEGRSTPILLDLKKSDPALAVKLHQKVYGTNERAHLAISGYIDTSLPPHHDTVQVRLYRTRLSSVLQNTSAADALEEVGRNYDAAPYLPTPLLHPNDGPAPEQVADKQVRIKGEDIEGFYYQDIDLSQLDIDLNHLDAGLYLVDLEHGDDTACTWLLVTDTALILKRAPGQSVAFVVDMKTGAPIANSEVRTYRGGQIVSHGITDSRGLAEIASPATKSGDAQDQQHLTTVAVRGQDEAVVARDWYRSEDNDDYVVHAYTDRTIYRPGQRISFKAIVRRKARDTAGSALTKQDANGGRSPLRYQAPSDLPVRVELRDKNGERVLDKTYTTNRYGSIAGYADLLKEAITGAYTLILHVDGEEHTQDVVVASYRKPEFAVTVQPDKPRYTKGEMATVTLEGAYFFGSPVAGAKVKYNVYRSPDYALEYADPREVDDSEDQAGGIHDRSEGYFGGNVTDGEAVLDENGRATIQFRAQADDDAKNDNEAPQEMVYTVHATVTEGADREVEADGQLRVVQGDFHLYITPEGYLAMPGRTTNVVLNARDYDGKPVANQQIALEYGYGHWQDDNYQYKPAGVVNAVTGANGEVVAPVTPPKSGELRLIARAKDAAQHTIVAHTDLWAARDIDSDLDTTYNDLSLLTDQRRYRPGQTARVLINAARIGETVLVTVEGDRVYHAETMTISQHSTVLRMPILEEYGPNAFLSACYVRDKHFATSDTPLTVSMPNSELVVTVRADRETPGLANGPAAVPTARYAPGDHITYYVQTTDKQGNPAPCEFSFGVVDESIYALREDDPRALRDAFYPRRTNYVSTLYSFAAEYLGDADKSEPQIEARKRFLDTADWEPILRTDERGQATVRFNLPDNLTTWRATVTAHTLDTKVGRAIDKVIVTKPFFVRLETPRTLTQRDRSQLVTLVHNETGKPQTARVHLRAEGLTVIGDGERELNIQPGEIGKLVWPVQADAFGEAKLKVTAWTIDMNASTQYTDGVDTTLSIRAHGREDAMAFAGELTAANPETEVVRLDSNVVPGTARLTVHITPSVGTALASSLDYLIGFPYGCTEQTMSRLLPDMLAQRAVRLSGLPPLPQQAQLPQMVREGLQRLYRFQHESGAWGWWEHDADDPWMTAYVLTGLYTAQELNYPVSPQVFAKGRKAAAELIKKVKPVDRPFLIYALALCGDKDAVAVERSHLTLASMDSEGLAYIVLADAACGNDVKPAWGELSRRAIDADSAVHWPTAVGRWDRDDQTTTAVGLRAMLAADRHDPRIGSVLRWLMRKRTGDYWSSTRDTSSVLAALCDYLTTSGRTTSEGGVRVQLNGSDVGAYQLSDNNLRERELTMRVPTGDLRPGKNDVTLVCVEGASPIFYTVELRQTVATEDMPAVISGNLSVKRDYLRLVSQKRADGSWTLNAEPSNNTLQSGQPIRVRLTIDAPRDMEYVLIEDAFPAGCEVSERGDADDVTDWSYWWSSVDVRDDRIAFFARDLPKGKHVVEYNLRAQTPGSYHTLPTLVQPMYAPELKALSDEARIEIK
jgi:uncharacterized protein YfaS (alpha-2-macroglobulin family)